MARDGVPRARIAADLKVSLRTVDTYLAQGRAAEAAVEAKRPNAATRQMRAAIEMEAPRQRKLGSTRIRFIPCGGPYVNDTTPQWWLDIRGKRRLARLAFAGDLVRDPVTGNCFDPADPRDVARIERLRAERSAA